MEITQTKNQRTAMAGTILAERSATRSSPPMMMNAVKRVRRVAMTSELWSKTKAPQRASDMLHTSMETNPRMYIRSMMKATTRDSLFIPSPLEML